ncbi:MAG: exopolysaccharide biosynthesis polyprenyl glycosylphosphotransferase [Pedosphaera sp. Tous-C6FEB]|nr:MAG: exopolysaccharide biosynthesis polyprenyl glycosylphosphotransferase [Pedosphaera sp. Tous-C6FEB]
MLRRQRQIRAQVQQWVDAGLFAIAFWLAHSLRVLAADYWPELSEIQPFDQYVWLYLLILPGTLLMLRSLGFYNRPLLYSRRETAWALTHAVTVAVLGVVTVLFLRKQELARSVLLLFGGLSFFLVMIKEELQRRWLMSALGQEQAKRRLVLIGTAEDTAALAHDLEGKARGAVEILAQLDLNQTSWKGLVELLHDRAANGVLLSARHTYFEQVEKVIELCELEGVEVWLLADFFKTRIAQTSVDDFLGRPMVVFRSAPEASWQGVAKQALDLVGALVLLVLSSPLMLLAALAVKWTSPGPVFFRQQRSGLNGRPFTMLKFRTMVTDAEQLKAELASFNEMDGPVFKVTNDPRVTPVGRWLRKWSVDELPQLWNVLRGEMSLVGPRPLPVDEIRRINDLAHRRRLSVKPGLTCLWQISGRNEVSSFKEWVRLDLEYIDNWSLWLDLKILLKTIPVVLTGAGAK